MAGKSQKGIRAYQSAKKLEGSGPTDRIVQSYDRLRQAAAEHDGAQVIELVRMMESALVYEANPEFALNLKKLYAYLGHCAEEHNFEEACRVANELYLIWTRALSAHSLDKVVLKQETQKSDGEGESA